jgi:transposase InsO family protein
VGWLPGAGTEPIAVAPASPWENGYIESFHSRLRDEFLVLQRRFPRPTPRAAPPLGGAALAMACGRLSVPRHSPLGPPQNLVEVPYANVQQMDEQRSHLGDGHLRLFFPPTALVGARET